jgi:hypothetical protein
VITVTLSRQAYRNYQKAYGQDYDPSDQDQMEQAYYDLRDDLVIQARQHGYQDIFDSRDDQQWHDAFEYAYLDGAAGAPVFVTETGEAVKLLFDWSNND